MKLILHGVWQVVHQSKARLTRIFKVTEQADVVLRFCPHW